MDEVPVAAAEPLPPTAEPERPLREELAQRVEHHRQRRAQVRGEPEESMSLEFDFEGAGREETGPQEEPDLVDISKEDVDREIVEDEAAVSVPEASSLDSVSLEKPEEETHFLDAVAADDSEPASVDDSAPPQPVEIVLDSPLPSAEEAGIEEGSVSLPLAPMGRRFLAGMLDALVLLASVGLFALVFWRAGGLMTAQALNVAVVAFVLVFLIMAYFGLFTALTSTTPGLLWMGLEVRSMDGGFPTPQEAFWRAFGCLVSTGALLLGFVWALVDSEGLTWHDRMSRTFLATASPDDAPRG